MGQHVDNSSIVSFGILTKVNGGNDDRLFRKKIVCMLPTTHTPPPSLLTFRPRRPPVQLLRACAPAACDLMRMEMAYDGKTSIFLHGSLLQTSHNQPRIQLKSTDLFTAVVRETSVIPRCTSIYAPRLCDFTSLTSYAK